MQSLLNNENLDSNETISTQTEIQSQPNHSPIVHQHVQKDAPCHAPGPLSFLQL
jgi:hypothetical protein